MAEKNIPLRERMEAAGRRLEEEGYPERTSRISGNAAKTLNSAITELFPCIAYLKEIKENDPEKFYKKILEENSAQLQCYIDNATAKQGEFYIKQAPKSEKFKEKVKNAIAILKFIKFQEKGKRISKIFWAPTKNKPDQIEIYHPGDVFIKYNDGKWIGISIKTGTETSKEPLFNTYIFNVISYFGESEEKWKKESYDKFYSKINKSFPIGSFSEYGKPKMVSSLGKFEIKDRKEYNKIYDEQLEWIIEKIISMLKKDDEKTKEWILKEIAKSNLSVPFITIKAIGDNYKEVTDIDIVKECVQRSKKNSGIVIEKSKTSKQEFYIYLICNNKKTKLLFSVRTNKSGNNHKLGQFVNLAFKFNGIEQ
jgi:hypothetical protein